MKYELTGVVTRLRVDNRPFRPKFTFNADLQVKDHPEFGFENTEDILLAQNLPVDAQDLMGKVVKITVEFI